MTLESKEFNPRRYMEMAVDEMKKSIAEPRKDKTSPKVGAVLVKLDGTHVSAHRGELRYGDHAEFTVLERKCRSEKLDGSIIFATLEPCAPGARNHPKLSCAERIVNARIKEVWIGIEDPDPKVDRKGIKFLQQHNVKIHLFDSDLQQVIREINKDFIVQAEDRALKAKKEPKQIILSVKEKLEPKAHLDDLSEREIEIFFDKIKVSAKFNSKEFLRTSQQLGLIEIKDNKAVPTGIGILLFGSNPQLIYPNAIIKATYQTQGRGEEIIDIDGPLVRQLDKIQDWYELRVGHQIDRSSVRAERLYDFPLVVFSEVIKNAILHRDYDIEGAPIYFTINDDAIIIKSPGKPVKPLTLEQIKTFNAPSLSRNPKIMYVFNKLELAQQRGLGFQTIKELPTKYNLPLPLIEFEDPYIVFTFPRNIDALRRMTQTDESLGQLTKEELEGYNWVRLKGEVSTREYGDKFGYEQRQASRHLKKMKELGLIETNTENLRAPNLRWLYRGR